MIIIGHTYGIKWSENLIKDKIAFVMKSLNIDRMPTRQECEDIIGDTTLSNKISKSGWYYYWANKLKLKMKDSNTNSGKDGESIIEKLLQDKGYDVKRMKTLYPYDLIVNNNVKIDVKLAYIQKKQTYKCYSFALNKIYSTCDLYILLTINQNNEIEDIYIIPSIDVKQTQITIGEKTKYSKYIDRYDYIDKYIEFYSSF